MLKSKKMNQKLINPNGEVAGLKVQTGYTKFYFFELSVTSPDITNSGKVTGRIKTFDYRKLYNIYALDETASLSQWIYKYNTDPDVNKVKTVNESTTDVNMEINLEYEIKGSNSPTTIYIYYSTINLNDANGNQKTYIVTNPASAYATDDKGHPYSGFRVIN
jgi:hypothetical protein